MQRFRIAAIFGGDPGRSLEDRLAAVTVALAEELGRDVGIWRPDADGHLTLVAASAGLIATALELQGADGRDPDPDRDLDEDEDEEPRPTWQDGLGLFPLRAARRDLGVLGVALDAPPDDALSELLATRARVLAVHLERELRHARALSRADAWQRLATSLSAAVTVNDVARVVAERCGATVDAASCAVALPRPRRTIRRIGDDRLGPSDASYDDALPLAEVMRSGRVVVVEDPTELARRYPLLAGASGAASGATRTTSPDDQAPLQSLAAAPVTSPRGDVTAVLAFGWVRPRQLGPTGPLELATLAEMCSQSLERARLFQQEAQERQAAEAAVDRLRRLQKATAALSAPLAFPAAARAVLREAVTLLGGTGGIITVASADGQGLELLARAGIPPDGEAWQGLEPGAPPDALVTAWRSGQPSWPEQGERGPVAVPLVWSGRTLGVLGVALDDGAPFGERQRLLAMTFAEQAAQALERARLYELEVRARHRADQLREGAVALSKSLGLTEVAEAATRAALAVAGADGAALVLRNEQEPDLFATVATEGVPPERAQLFRRFRLRGAGPLGEVIRQGHPAGIATFDEAGARWPAYADVVREAGYEAWQVLPLERSDEIIGALLVGFERPHPPLPEELAALAGLASQAAQAIDRARRYELERKVAVSLQRTLLTTELPQLAGLRIEARYRSAGGRLEVGGDWYDALDVGDGRVYLATGDVVGRGIAAAAAMGQLRSTARGMLLTRPGPAELLERLDHFVAEAPDAAYSSLACVVLDTVRGELSYSLAGSLPPLLRTPTGVVVLDGARGAPLGATTGPRAQVTMPIEAGSLLVMYTDGLVERRRELLDVGVSRLVSALEGLGGGELDARADALVDDLLAGQAPDDDLALVSAAFDAPADRAYLRRYPSELRVVADARHELRSWLAGLGLEGDVTTDMLVAAAEATNNAIEHAQSGAMVTIRAHQGAQDLVVRVRDDGRWQQPSRTTSSARGLGLPIMRSLVDAVEVHRGEEGTTVVLRRSLNSLRPT